jgi:hypothetical protein
MKVRTNLLTHILVLVWLCALASGAKSQAAQGPGDLVATDSPIIIPPTVSRISPAGMERGKTAIFDIEGRNLTDATEVLFDAPGMTGKVSAIADVPEKLTGPRAGEDLGAQVPLGKKQIAKLEITIAVDARPGLHRFRIKTSLGTTNTMVFAVGSLPEVKAHPDTPMDAASVPQRVELPATMTGNIGKSGDQEREPLRCGAPVPFGSGGKIHGCSLRPK